MNKIQSTRLLTPVELNSADGYEFDFDSTMKYCSGIAILGTNTNLDYSSNFSLKFDSEEIFPDNTPVFLLQSSGNVQPNKRFFNFNPKEIYKKKFRIKSNTSNSFRLIFLLDDSN